MKQYDFLMPGEGRWVSRQLTSDRIAMLACQLGGFLAVTCEDDEFLYINLPD